MRILVTGITGFVGAALVPRLQRDGHELRGFARDPSRASSDIPVVKGDVVAGSGLDEALDGVEATYFLIHSMEPATNGTGFADRERTAAENFARAAQAAGVRQIVYLGGPVPGGALSAHLASRLAVEEILLMAAPDSTALRASIIIGARSRSFRFLVRLVERIPVLALPAWRENRTRPIDQRDVIELLAASLTMPEAAGQSLDIGGPDILSYAQMIECIRDLMLLGRPRIDVNFSATAIAAPLAAAVAGETVDLVLPLMQGLDSDLLPRDDRTAELLGVRLHPFAAAVERSLREWEAVEELRAR
ncbi:MAG: NAD(P)H-binding protein [Solirubrobacteraceae bacterium]